MKHIIVKLNSRSNPTLCRWIDEIDRKYPKNVMTYATAAITEYISKGTYLNIGTVPEDTSYVFAKDSYAISILIDEDILTWSEMLIQAGVSKAAAIKGILEKSIRTGNEVIIPSPTELKKIKIPTLNSYQKRTSDHETNKTLEEDTKAINKTAHQIASKPTTLNEKIKEEPAPNNAQPSRPSASSSGSKKNRSIRDSLMTEGFS